MANFKVIRETGYAGTICYYLGPKGLENGENLSTYSSFLLIIPILGRKHIILLIQINHAKGKLSNDVILKKS